MKTLIVYMVLCLSLMPSVGAAMTEAESLAINTGTPRDCSLLVDTKQKTACNNFNKTLAVCLATGYRIGLELKSCMVKKGALKR